MVVAGVMGAGRIASVVDTESVHTGSIDAEMAGAS